MNCKDIGDLALLAALIVGVLCVLVYHLIMNKWEHDERMAQIWREQAEDKDGKE